MFEVIPILRLIRVLNLELLLKGTVGNSSDWIKETFLTLENPYKDKEEIVTLINVVKDIVNLPEDSQIPSWQYKDLLKSTISSVGDKTIDHIFTTTVDEKNMEQEIKQELPKLKVLINAELSLLTVNKLRGIIRFSSDNENYGNDYDDALSNLEKLSPTTTGGDEIINTLDMSKPETIMEILKKSKAKSNTDAIYKTHLTGLNDMCQGGFRVGETIAVVGSQFSFKSGLLLTTFCAMLLLNPPKKTKLEGRPTALWYSFEDPMDKILADVYGFLKMWDNPECERIDLDQLDMVEVAKYIKGRFDETGYDVRFYEYNPTDFSFRKGFSLIDKEIKEGASVKIVGYDYLPMITKAGCSTTGATGADTRELTRRYRNYMKSKDILFMTPWQLSSGGNNLLREGLSPRDLVKRVANKGFTADSAQINQELDLEISVAIVEMDGESFLMAHRGKHKLSTVIDDVKKMQMVVQLPSNGNKLYPDVEYKGKTPKRRCYYTLEDVGSDFTTSEDIEGVF